MNFGDDGAAPAALDALKDGLEQLLKVVEDGGLESLDPAGTVGFWQGFERLRNRMALVDHQIVRDAQAKNLAAGVCQTSLPGALAATLLISVPEANRRVRAADAVAERTSMLGEVLEPVRPYLAAAQRPVRSTRSRST